MPVIEVQLFVSPGIYQIELIIIMLINYNYTYCVIIGGT